MDITNNTYRILENLLSALLGALSPIAVQWIVKRRNKVEQENDSVKAVTDAAKINLDAAQDVIEMFKQLMVEERKHFDERLELAKKDCSDRIAQLKEEKDKELQTLRENNEAMDIKILRLRERLSKYENETTDKFKAISKQDIANASKNK